MLHLPLLPFQAPLTEGSLRASALHPICGGAIRPSDAIPAAEAIPAGEVSSIDDDREPDSPSGDDV